MNEYADLIRWVNVVLAGASLAMVMFTLFHRWDDVSRRERHIQMSFGLVLFVVAYGSGEAASKDVPLGLRVFMMLFALMALAHSLMWHFDESP